MVARVTDPKVRLSMDPSQYEKGSERATLATQRLLKAQNAADRQFRAMVGAHNAAIREDEARTAALARAVEDAEHRKQEAYKKTGQVATVAGAAVLAGITYTAKQAVSWQAAFTGVTKTVDGTAEQLAVVEDGLRGIAGSLPATHEEIAAVAEAAGQLGVKRDAIVGFTKTMIDLGETTDLSADEAATGIAKLVNVLDSSLLQSPDAISRLGSAIVALGNDGASTESEILAMSQRIAGAADLVGATAQETLALSSTLATLGLSAEAGGSATARALTKMYAAVKDGGKALDSFASTAGQTSAEFAALFADSPVEALDAYVKGLARIDGEGGNVVATLREVGFKSTEDQRALLTLKGAGDRLVDTLKLSNRAWDENRALVDEANKRYDTAGAKVQIAQNALRDAGISIGETFLPAISGAAEGVADLAKTIADLPEPLTNALGVMGALVGAVALAGGAIILALPKWKAFKDTLAALEDSKAATTIRGVGRAAGIVTVVTAAFVGLTAAVEGLTHAAEGVSSVATTTEQLLDGSFDSLFDGLGAGVDRVNGLDEAIRRVADPSVMDRLQDVGGSVRGIFGGGDTARTKAIEQFNAIGQSLATMVQSGNAEKAGELFSAIANRWTAAGHEIEDLRALMPDYVDALAAADTEQQLAATSAEGFTERLNAATGATEELTDAQLEYLDAIAASDAAFISLSQAYSDTVDDAKAAAQAKADAFNAGQEAAEKAAREQGKTLELARKSWEDFYDGRTVSVDKYLDKLQQQVDTQNQWEADLLTLTSRGVSQSTIDALHVEGVDAAPLISQLAAGSDEQLARLEELYAEAGGSATQQFADQLTAGAPVLVAAGDQLGRDAVDAIVRRMLEGKDTLAQIVAEYGLIVEGFQPPWEGAFTSPSAPDSEQPDVGIAKGRGFTQYPEPIGPGLDSAGSSYPSMSPSFPSAGIATPSLGSTAGTQLFPVAVPVQIMQQPDQATNFYGDVTFTDPQAATRYGASAKARANTGGRRPV
ncbi:MAG: phage tail tape measure protein [Cellulomonas sp.]|uniref:phage tail tape measure protein n=1 Tax=Cellulomonas sp. TaxID=40001 RepID=UPI0025849F20|nr:phage tail tape measure protein [Cellulomonas sp.]MCR6703156.1 phage tail tape measure protein [Cellulomonas sp.]